MLVFSKRGQALIGQEMFNILERAKEIERSGKRVYHLELGEPTSYPPGRIINKTIMSLLEYNVGYAPSGGLITLREELAAFYSVLVGRSFSIENVAISPANLLIFQFLELVCDPNDRLILFTPSFPTYLAASQYMGLDVRKVALDESEGFRMSKGKVDEAMAHKPKAIIVNSANNPTGAVYTEEVLKYLVKVAERTNCWLLSDETYGLLVYTEDYFSLLKCNYDRLVMISSYSKILCVPGYRVGYAIALPEIIEKLSLSSSTLYSCLPIFTQEGCVIGTSVIDEFTKDLRTKYTELINSCVLIIEKSPYLNCIKPDSGFYLFIDIRKCNLDDATFCRRLLEEYHTALTPGRSFAANGFVRASICGDVKDVEAGLNRVVQFANTLSD